MELFSAVLRAFFCGGILCLIGQILIDKTALTPAKILTSYVVAGVLLGAAGLYAPIQEWGGAGAAVPLTGFGANLAKGVREAVAEQGGAWRIHWRYEGRRWWIDRGHFLLAGLQLCWPALRIKPEYQRRRRPLLLCSSLRTAALGRCFGSWSG